MNSNQNDKFTVTKLKSLLYFKLQELSENAKIYNELILKKELFNEIIKILNSNIETISANKISLNLCLENIFDGDNCYSDRLNKILAYIEIYKKKNDSIELNKWENELLNFKQNIREVYDDIELKLLYLNDIKHNFFTYKKILSNLKYHQMMSKEQLKIIINFLKEKNIDDKNIILICEQIRVFSNNINNKFDPNFNKFSFLNILNTGYESFPKINIKNRKDIIQKANNILSMKKIYKDNLEDFVEQLPKYSENTQIEEYKCLYFEIMKQLQNEIKELVDMANNDEFYMNNEIKSIIINDYNELVKFYNLIRNYFDKQIDELNNSISKDNKYKDGIYNIHFLISNIDGKTFFENDLKTIPQEYLNKIVTLLENKKYNELGKDDDKQLTENKKFKYFRELRDDQIRIIYKALDKTNILVLGVGVKKDDNDIPLYKRLTERIKNYDKLLQDRFNQEDIYEQILDYCKNNHRKGNR